MRFFSGTAEGGGIDDCADDRFAEREDRSDPESVSAISCVRRFRIAVASASYVAAPEGAIGLSEWLWYRHILQCDITCEYKDARVCI